ncbi:Leu/Ile/Val-binding protein precursor [Rubripirellula lacrimiformis]|uniref:Leu/Ile/Val-binding protein n=1 Tax=Rubripirellula lacrimiformis TaxID=1930273 RepID=A0A517NIJ2_9BACT|nr:ABC transporter substrate-binding protein [Rubripirellula lacrimiformis]QDT06955.1 Leu/Ile/Val-binding protein precursor [Rubripirellula lacrimiformis]
MIFPDTGHRYSICATIVVCCVVLFAPSPLRAATHDPNTNIVLGMSTALSGPASDLGINMKLGVDLALKDVNHRGGIGGKPIRLVALDDGYEPARTIINMRQLIEKENVLGVIGNVGTPTAIAAVPIANETRTPFLAAYSGAGVLRRDPPDRYVVNYRASYAEETTAMVNALITQVGLKPTEVAFFTQRDGYGDAGFIGGIQALKKHGLQSENQIVHGRYERNTLAVELALAEIMLHKVPPKAIIMVGAYAPCAQFIRLAKSMDYHGLFLNVSFVGSLSLARELAEQSTGVIVTQVVPHPNSELPIAIRYRQAMQQFGPQPADYSFGSLEGFIAARILISALQSKHFDGGRESVIRSLESMGDFPMGLPEPLRLTTTDHQASHMVWPTVLINGSVVPIEWSDLSGERTRE